MESAPTIQPQAEAGVEENAAIEEIKQEISVFTEILEGYNGEVLSGERAQAAEATAFALTAAHQKLRMAKLEAQAANDNRPPFSAIAA